LSLQSIQLKPWLSKSISWSDRSPLVGVIEVAHPAAQPLVERLVEQVPVEAGVDVPFEPLPELAAHEHQLLARMRVNM
jgi:hypothetical protein